MLKEPIFRPTNLSRTFFCLSIVEPSWPLGSSTRDALGESSYWITILCWRLKIVVYVLCISVLCWITYSWIVLVLRTGSYAVWSFPLSWFMKNQGYRSFSCRSHVVFQRPLQDIAGRCCNLQTPNYFTWFKQFTLSLFSIAMENHMLLIGKPSINGPSISWRTVSHNQRVRTFGSLPGFTANPLRSGVNG
jgi:hypothetical protein